MRVRCETCPIQDFCTCQTYATCPLLKRAEMTVYVRKFPCAVCGENVYWDSETQLLTCGCGKFHANSVDLREYIPLPKYDRKYWESKTIPIDRDSIFKGNENPRMALRWIHYPRKDKVQLCLAVSGTFHTEKIAYNRKEAKQWHERMWIFISAETVKELIGFLQRNPQLLASWM